MELTAFDIETAKMRSLIERMSRPHTAMQGIINEEKHLNEGIERRVESPEKVFDILDQIGKNNFVCVGYVTGANLNLPKAKRLNPETNKMNSYDDMEAFSREIGSEEQIAALVKITSYNFRYYSNSDMKKKYGEYKSKYNDIRTKYGLDPVADKENRYTQTMNYGSGFDTYSGNDESKKGHFYVPSNIAGANVKGVIYAINADGNIIKELPQEQIESYIKERDEKVPGEKALRKMGREEAEIQKYIDEVSSLNMKYKSFEGNSILWVAASVNGQKIVYINSKLNRTVNDININPQDFVAKAKERYNVDMNNISGE